MLKVEHISEVKVLKDEPVYRNEWKMAKLAKFSSSKASVLMGEKQDTIGALSYIYEKVGEEISGQPAHTEIDNESTRWGLIHEADGTKKLGEALGVEFLVTQTLITIPGTRFGSTPDAIWPIKKYGDAWDVETGEIKCYPSYSRMIRCMLCDTPADVKKADPDAYWQVIDQVDMCDSMRGNLGYYHPAFRGVNFKLIRFRKIELIEDFKLLKIRKKLAEQTFDIVRQKILNIKN